MGRMYDTWHMNGLASSTSFVSSSISWNSDLCRAVFQVLHQKPEKVSEVCVWFAFEIAARQPVGYSEFNLSIQDAAFIYMTGLNRLHQAQKRNIKDDRGRRKPKQIKADICQTSNAIKMEKAVESTHFNRQWLFDLLLHIGELPTVRLWCAICSPLKLSCKNISSGDGFLHSALSGQHSLN